jgi:hypothetical protein
MFSIPPLTKRVESATIEAGSASADPLFFDFPPKG